MSTRPRLFGSNVFGCNVFGGNFLRRNSAASRRRGFAFEQLETRLAMATLYVAPNGSDAGSGGSGSPWLTLQKAADSVRAGDMVIVAPGQYTGFDLRTDGTAAAPIQFLAQSGVQIIARNARTPDGINLEGADYVTIQGFEINNMPRAGIRSVTNHHVTIRDNRADSNEKWGILTGFSDDLLIEGNRTSNSKIEHGIYVSNSGDRPIIRNNEIFGNRGNGIHMNGDLSAGGDGMIDGALVENNTIYNNGRGGGSGINGDGLRNSRIQNNLLYNNHASGISLYKIDGAAGSSGNFVINNTVVQADDGRWAMNIQDASINNTLRNNIFYNFNSYPGSIAVSVDSLPGLNSDYNVLMDRLSRDGGEVDRITLSQWQAATGDDVHSIIATPAQLFANVAASDYRLSANSPALNIGTLQFAPNFDRAGQPRPSGAGVDIGAFETQVTFAPTIQLTTTATATNRTRLTWTDNVVDETGFRIERSTAGGSYTTVTTVAANSTSYDNTQLQSSVTYNYRVRSVTGSIEGALSNTAAATTPQLGTITGTSAADAYHAIRVGSQLHIYENTAPTGTPTYSSELSALSTIVTFDTLGGNDTLNVNVNGQFTMGVGRIVYDSGTGTNTLNLLQGAATIDSTTTGVLNTTVGSNAQLTTTRLRQNSLTIGSGGRVTLARSGSAVASTLVSETTNSSVRTSTPLAGSEVATPASATPANLKPSIDRRAFPLSHDTWLAVQNAVWAGWNLAGSENDELASRASGLRRVLRAR